MANGMLQLIGLIIASIGGVCILVATFVPEWRRNDPSGEVLESIIYHQGIWIKCVSYPTGLWQCDDFDKFFIGLAAPLQVSRGLTCAAIGLGFFAFVMALVGMDCTSCLEDNQKLKSRIGIISGILWMLAGFCVGTAVSYYSYQVLSEYNLDLIIANNVSQRYVYGACLFVGWAALVVCFVGGLLMACGSRYEDEDADRVPYRPANYSRAEKISKPNYNTEYV